MLSALRTFGRVLWRHWPALLAWYLVSTALHDLWISLAGWAGAQSSIVGIMLMPIAALLGLTGYIGMFLVVRDSLPQLVFLAPLPTGRRQRLREFTSTLLAAILPYFAFYVTWGFFAKDMQSYARVAEQAYEGLVFSTWDLSSGEALSTDGRITDFAIGPVTLAILVVAYALRWLGKRYEKRLPAWLAPFSVYLEGVWVFMAVYLISDAATAVTAWVDTRVGMVWLDGITSWISVHLVVVSIVWDAVVWFIGQAGGVLLLPLAWLTIAGVVYGQAITVSAPKLRPRTRGGRRIHERYGRLGDGTRRRVQELFAPLTDRFAAIGRSVLLMWRAGPVLLGLYALCYAGWTYLDAGIGNLLPHLFGPHDLDTYWVVVLPLIQLIVPVVMEPVRIALVSAAYDTTLAELASRKDDGEPQDVGAGDDVEDEGAARVVG